MNNLKDAVIVAYGRSPIGRATKGTLVGEYPVKLASEVLKGVLEKVPNLPLGEIDDVIVGDLARFQPGVGAGPAAVDYRDRLGGNQGRAR